MNYRFMKNNIHLIPAVLLILMVTSCAKPIAMFSSDADHVKAPVEIKFNNESKKADTYSWDFGDGNTSVEASPQHKYYLSGHYTVQLKATKGSKESIMEKQIVVDPPHDCLIEMETTLGTMTIQLSDLTPLHRDNFVKLAETGFYDGLIFHRVIEGFMIQGGDPESKNATEGQRLGSGGPGYQIPAEFDKTLFHVKGALASARTGGPSNPEKKSSGSQFYIVDGKPLPESQIAIMEAQKGIKYDEKAREILINEGGTPFLDQEYTVFGQVVKGLDIIDKIAAVETAPGDRPLVDVKIIRVRAIK